MFLNYIPQLPIIEENFPQSDYNIHTTEEVVFF